MQSGYTQVSLSEGLAGFTLNPTPIGAIKITKVIDYIGDYNILFGNGKYWYAIWYLSVQEASSAIGMLSA